MASALKEQLTAEMKACMKAKDKARLGVVRALLAAIKQVEIDNQTTLEDDAEVLAILDKAMKQRKDSHQQYVDAERSDLAEQEAYEMSVIQDFMPQALTEDEISALIDEAMAETGAASMQDMGKVMGLLKPKMQGRADMGEVSKLIKAKLSA
ncbi:GatB/YqeY domain-containing protein [Thiomicrorhabdus xiamenensis]|uniref:GatB/YqeY domain-containing protein n=1 Tax=Thiomicrorhabdus xiamenensis TaxID=2739063 RepID=A0A7D4NPM1_9GAMM|nr:GatB/YqeY domain-containing protein [Thiomicrorhabdus xiamenensis]QKI88531.1 GatB/YqeY domain-containing protein [Thiomicrorhabdus xiamenensis]